MMDSTYWGPVRPPTLTITQPYVVTLQPDQIMETDVEQMVPSHVALGTYLYHVRVGEYVDHINDILEDEGVLEIEVRV